MPLEFVLKPHKTGLSVYLVCMYIECIYRYIIMFALRVCMHICVYVCILYSYMLLCMCSKGENLERRFLPGLQLLLGKVERK